MFISVDQALNLWHELELAYREENRYGGDTAEIYAYTLMPHSPAWARNPDSAIFREDFERLYVNAKGSLCYIIGKFMEKYKCGVTIDDANFALWATSSVVFSHRCHIQIKKED